jgi:hypothetical protein
MSELQARSPLTRGSCKCVSTVVAGRRHSSFPPSPPRAIALRIHSHPSTRVFTNLLLHPRFYLVPSSEGEGGFRG